MSQFDRHDSIAANCKVCGTRVTPDVRFAGQDIGCPDCLSTISVPTLEQHKENVRGQQQQEVSQPEDVGTYGLAAPPPVEEDDPPSSKADSPPIDDIFQDQPASSTERDRARRKKPRRKKKAAARESEEPASSMTALEALAEIKRHEVPEPPKNLFFSNVFQFPWSTISALQRWGFLTFTLLLNLLLIVFLIYLREELGEAALIPTAFLGLAELALFTWAGAYAAASAMSIIQDTSAGNDEVIGWPEGGVGDWFGDFFVLMVLMIFGGFFSYLACLPISFMTGTFVPYLFIIHVLITPVVILSGLDAQTVLFPISQMVVHSFKTVTKSWIQLTALTTSLLVAVSTIVGVTTSIEPFIAALINAPLLAATAFIYARLLGRMAFTIGQNAPDDASDNKDADSKDDKKQDA